MGLGKREGGFWAGGVKEPGGIGRVLQSLLDMSVVAVIQQKIKSLPGQPGCYLYHGGRGEIIYIGKAKNLRKRVSSYFQKIDHDPKTRALVAAIRDLEFIVTDSELEALFLEARLIKDHQPKYNIDLKSGTRYAYIRITDEEFPRLETARTVSPRDTVFGPFASGTDRQRLIRLANDVFALRARKNKPVQVGERFQILTSVPPWKRWVTREEYQRDVANATLLLKGKSTELRDQLLQEMNQFSKREQFELARLRRDQLQALDALGQRQKIQLKKSYNQDVIDLVQTPKQTVIQMFTITKGVVSGRKQFTFAPTTLHDFIRQYYYTHEIPQEIIVPELPSEQRLLEQYVSQLAERQVNIIVPVRGEKKALLDLVHKNVVAGLVHGDAAVFELQTALHLPALPRRIECFDISNLGSTDMVASMVTFVDGVAHKSHYRRFKIRTLRGQSDVDAMGEVVYRRFVGELATSLPKPDLVLVDGGKAQLGAALESFKRLGITLPIVALAKKQEELFLPGKRYPVQLPRTSAALKLVQRVRDEAHRFAITYHRLLRSKRLNLGQ